MTDVLSCVSVTDGEVRAEVTEEVEDSATITAAVFYSITSTQKGLQVMHIYYHTTAWLSVLT